MYIYKYMQYTHTLMTFPHLFVGIFSGKWTMVYKSVKNSNTQKSSDPRSLDNTLLTSGGTFLAFQPDPVTPRVGEKSAMNDAAGQV